jgi:hypothetical protein
MVVQNNNNIIQEFYILNVMVPTAVAVCVDILDVT